jgi:hypothetical protein
MSDEVNYVKPKTRRISFRIEEPLYQYLLRLSKGNGLTISELLRNILIYFHTSALVGGINFEKITKRFLKRYGKKMV